MNFFALVRFQDLKYQTLSQKNFELAAGATVELAGELNVELIALYFVIFSDLYTPEIGFECVKHADLSFDRWLALSSEPKDDGPSYLVSIQRLVLVQGRCKGNVAI